MTPCTIILPSTAKMFDEPAYASPPFDHPKANIILRTSDEVDFRVFSLFLSLASPFFEALFDIPQSAGTKKDQEVRDGLSVVPVAENSRTLDALLRFCYPCTLAEDPKIEVLADAIDVLEAARKYSLDTIEKKVRQAISTPKILETKPLQCFVIAHRGRLREETLLAAKYTLTQPLIPTWFKEIELLTATDLLSLLTYHQRCGDAVHALRLDLSWITTHYGSAEACSWLSGQTQCKTTNTDYYGHVTTQSQSNGNCGCPRSTKSNSTLSTACGFKLSIFNANINSLQWWEDFMEETFAALRDKPCKETLQMTAEKTVQTVKAKNCQSCSQRITEGMRDFVDLFTKKIEEAVARVELQLEF